MAFRPLLLLCATIAVSAASAQVTFTSGYLSTNTASGNKSTTTPTTAPGMSPALYSLASGNGTPDLATSSGSFTSSRFLENATASGGSSQTSVASIVGNFFASLGTTYSIDPGTATGTSQFWTVALLDSTKGTELYYAGAGVLRGSATGTLNSTDSYFFETIAASNPNASGVTGETVSSSITFANGNASPTAVTPEPSGFILLGSGLAAVAGLLRRRWQLRTL